MRRAIGAIEVRQYLAGDRRIDFLKVHDLFSRRAAEMFMRKWLRAYDVERLPVSNLIGQNAPIGRENLSKLRPAVTIIVNPDVCLSHQDLLLRAVVRSVVGFVGLIPAGRFLFGSTFTPYSRKRIHQNGVKSHVQQVGSGLLALLPNKSGLRRIKRR